METDPFKRQCWNCSQQVFLDQTNCPFCSAALLEKLKQTAEAKERRETDLEDSLAPLYTPPYAISGRNKGAWQDSLPQQQKIEAPAAKEESVSSASSHKEFWSILLLSFAGHLLALGLLLLFFSENGFLTLSWKSRYWFAYVLLSVPFFVFGWRQLKKINS